MITVADEMILYQVNWFKERIYHVLHEIFIIHKKEGFRIFVASFRGFLFLLSLVVFVAKSRSTENCGFGIKF